MIKTNRIGLFLLMMVAGGYLSIAIAQNPYDTDIYAPHGIMPNTDQVSDSLDSINPASGQLNVRIPLGSLKGGPAGLGFDLQLLYDSNLYDFPNGFQGDWHKSVAGGWKYNIENYRLDLDQLPPLVVDPAIYAQCGTWNSQGLANRYRLRIGLPDGSLHVLHLLQGPSSLDPFSSTFYTNDPAMKGFYAVDPSGASYIAVDQNQTPMPACNQTRYNQLLTYYTTDGSHLKLEIPTSSTNLDWTNKEWRLYYPDGRIVVGMNDHVTEIHDANGNTMVLTHINGSYSTYGSGTFTVLSYAGSNKHLIIQKNYQQSGTITRDRIIARGPNGDMTWYVDWDTLSTYPSGFSSQVVKQIQLPLASADEIGVTPPTYAYNNYVFNYYPSDSAYGKHGFLQTIHTPSGSQSQYAYSFPATYPFWKIAQKTITHDASASLTWAFTYYGSGLCPSTPDLAGLCTDVTNPDGGVYRHYYYDSSNGSFVNYLSAGLPDSAAGLVYRVDGPNGSVHKRNWKQQSYSSQNIHLGQNLYLGSESATVGNASGQPSKTAVTEYDYDANGNLAWKKEYDWVSFNGAYFESAGVLKRQTTNNYYLSVTSYQSVDGYWQPHNTNRWAAGSARRLNAVQRSAISNGTTTYAATEFVYANSNNSAYTSGNIVSEKHWDSVKFSSLPSLGDLSTSNSQVLTRSYDSYGNLTGIIEPEVPTTNQYDSTGSHIVSVTKAGQRQIQSTWANDVAIQSMTDVENGITTYYVYDNAGRPTSVSEGISTSTPSGMRQTVTTYDDANRSVMVAGDLNTLGDGALQAITYYDQLGRAVLVQQSDGLPLYSDPGIKAKTTYIEPSGSGKIVITSTPYRNVDFSDTTMQWTCSQYDRLGRVTATAMFKGSVEPSDCTSTTNRTGISVTEYFADNYGVWTVVTDPAGKKRKMGHDALGRLIKVVEDPDVLAYETTYEYDPLDNLLSVTQYVQTRTFSYSSLGRLRSATNPESGMISYVYYDSGDLYSKTDARSVTTAMTYDSLHRIATKSYSDDTPAVTYNYHVANTSSAPNIGQLQSVASSVSTNAYTYDLLGRVATSVQTMHTEAGDIDYAFSYLWYLNGSLKYEAYPSGRQVSYSVDGAGRTNKVYDAGKTFVDMTTITNPYAPDGRIAKMKFGNNLWATMDYRAPGTATVYQLGTAESLGDLLQLQYNYDATANNGNVISQDIIRDSNTWHQAFQYDALNRLTDASETGGFHQQYQYDRYGNRTTVSTGIPDDYRELNSSYSASNNRLISNRAGTVYYDAAGNQTNYGVFSLFHDAENKIKTFADGNEGVGAYFYDGAGKRVKKFYTPNGWASFTTTYYIYDALGQLASEYTDGASTSSGTFWMFADMLGSVRAITSEAGLSGYGTVTQCSDYLPFGRMLGSLNNGRGPCHPSDPDTLGEIEYAQGFTGKVRDSETGLDYFGARYMSAPQGRFITPDQPFADQYPEEPQSWNLYAYASNNPLKFIDKSGEKVELVGTPTERDNELKLIGQTIGSGYDINTQQLIININFGFHKETIDGSDHYYVDPDPKSNQNLGYFGEMLTSNTVIEIHLSNSATFSVKNKKGQTVSGSLYNEGGSTTIPGFNSTDKNIQIFMLPTAYDYANSYGKRDGGFSST